MPKTAYYTGRRRSTKNKISRARPTVGHLSDLATVHDMSFKLNALPTEVFQLILPYLDKYALLALQFVSRAINAKTKNWKGEALVETKIEWRKKTDKSIRYWLKLEATWFPYRRLPRLTCSGCGKRKANCVTGFTDQQFKKGKGNRECIECHVEWGTRRWMRDSTVHKEAIRFCTGEKWSHTGM